MLTGCTSWQDVITDTQKPESIMSDDISVKIIYLSDYPEVEDGREVYLKWVVSVADDLRAPEEIKRIRSYDNMNQNMNPYRLIEFEFDSFVDAYTYMNRPEIAKILSQVPSWTSNARSHTFIQRSDHSRYEQGKWDIMDVLFINYPLGVKGKQSYLDWVEHISMTSVTPSQVKIFNSYDNYFGESPHRMVQLEFANQSDLDDYHSLEHIKDIRSEIMNRSSSYSSHTFKLRSEYVKE